MINEIYKLFDNNSNYNIRCFGYLPKNYDYYIHKSLSTGYDADNTYSSSHLTINRIDIDVPINFTKGLISVIVYLLFICKIFSKFEIQISNT